MLIEAIPRLHETREKLPVIEGMIDRELIGCPFYNRCPYAAEKCNEQMPSLSDYSPTHKVACYFPLEVVNKND